MNARFVVPLTVVALALLISACPKQVETVPEPVTPTRPTPPPIRVPEGCEAVIDGRFVHSQNAAYRYLAQDDGGTLTLFVERGTADGGVTQDDAGTVISLHRTANGFNGLTDAVVFTQRGARCRVSFPTDVVACEADALVLRAAASGSVDDQCRAPAKLPPAAKVEHRLVRPGADAGTVGARTTDAGTSELKMIVDGGTSMARDAGSMSEAKSARDAGSVSDMKSVHDAGSVSDMKSVHDAGSVSDMKSVRDAGSVSDAKSGRDAGSVSDTKSVRDAGSVSDAKSGRDAGSGSDTESVRDAGTGSDTTSVRDAGTAMTHTRSTRDAGTSTTATKSARDAG